MPAKLVQFPNSKNFINLLDLKLSGFSKLYKNYSIIVEFNSFFFDYSKENFFKLLQ